MRPGRFLGLCGKSENKSQQAKQHGWILYNQCISQDARLLAEIIFEFWKIWPPPSFPFQLTHKLQDNSRAKNCFWRIFFGSRDASKWRHAERSNPRWRGKNLWHAHLLIPPCKACKSNSARKTILPQTSWIINHMGMNLGSTISIHTFDLTTGKFWSGAKGRRCGKGFSNCYPWQNPIYSGRSEHPIPRIVQVRVDLWRIPLRKKLGHLERIPLQKLPIRFWVNFENSWCCHNFHSPRQGQDSVGSSMLSICFTLVLLAKRSLDHRKKPNISQNPPEQWKTQSGGIMTDPLLFFVDNFSPTAFTPKD